MTVPIAQAICIAKHTASRQALLRSLTIRQFSSGPPPPSQSTQKPKRADYNTLLLVASGTAAAAGIYWYISRPQEVKRIKDEVKKAEADVLVEAKDLGGASKTYAQEMISQGREKYADAKAAGQEKLGLAQSAEAKAHQTAQSAYDNAKTGIEKMQTEAQNRATKGANDATPGWYSWLGARKTKTQETKREATAKEAGTTEGFRKGA